MKRRTLLALVPLALLACACGRSQASAERAEIAVIPKGTTHEFWRSIHAGARKAGLDLDVDVLWQGPLREDDRADQIRVIEGMIARGVDGILCAPLDDAALAPPLAEAARMGIPVVVIDSGVDWDGQVSFVATDNRRGGELAGRHLARLLGGEGRVLLLRYMEGSASTRAREEGFLAAVAAHPGIEVVSSDQHGGASSESAFQASENLLNRFEALDGIFCPNESTTFGMLLALEDAERTDDVAFVGFDASAKLVEALRAGSIDALVVQDPFAMGELGVRAMVDHLAGKEVARRVDTGVVLATPANCREPDVARLLEPELERWLR